MPSGQQIALWRTVDPDFDKYYEATPYGDKALFLSIYKEVFKWFYDFTGHCKPIVITETLPEKYIEKYFLKPGDEFESLIALIQHCKMVNKCKSPVVGTWKSLGYIKETGEQKTYPNIEPKPRKPIERGFHVIVSWTMPKKLCDKYKIKPGDKFKSLKALREHCGCSVFPPSYWLKKHWIEKQQ